MSKKPDPLIVIVDDDVAHAKLLSFMLSRYYQTLIVNNGEEACEQIETSQPDVIILDIMMPEMDGFSVCDQLKANPKTQNIPIVFVTGLEDDLNQEDAFGAGAADFLLKPISPKVLKARVNRIFENKVYVDYLEAMLAGETPSELMLSRVKSMLARQHAFG